MFEQMLVEVLAPVAVTVAGAIVTWGLAEVARWMRGRVKSEETQGAIMRVHEAAQSVVAELEATTRKNLARDGRLSGPQAFTLKKQAVHLVESQLDGVTRQALTRAVNGMLQEYLGGVVERALLTHKQEKIQAGPG